MKMSKESDDNSKGHSSSMLAYRTDHQTMARFQSTARRNRLSTSVWSLLILLLLFLLPIVTGTIETDSQNEEDVLEVIEEQEFLHTSSWSFWKLVPLIARIRHGPQWDERNQSDALLSDPQFLYQTFYRYCIMIYTSWPLDFLQWQLSKPTHREHLANYTEKIIVIMLFTKFMCTCVCISFYIRNYCY